MAPKSSSPGSSAFEGEFAPGQVLIGRYRIVALLGEGGMGQVYLADDLVLGQPVAVKFLPAHIAEHEGGLDRFRAEVRHAREVTHPNVARVHDIGEVDGRHFLTMEFVDGEDLASLVRRIGRLPREKAAEIAQQICAGLSEAHQRGVLHRDLKPANVMLDGEGRVKLTDFGLAVAADGSGDSALAGTPQYMAPEQLSGVRATVRSEVYSLGLVLYELYTGRRALRGRNMEELRREHEEGPVHPPSSVHGEIAPEVDAVLSRCLARDPADRPAAVRDVALALPGGDPLAAALAEGETPAPELVAAAKTSGAMAPRAALALAIASALLFAGFALLRTSFLDRKGISYGKAPPVLDDRAREVFKELTGRSLPEYEVHWYALDRELVGRRLGTHASGDAAPPEPSGIQPLLRHTRFSLGPFLPKGTTVLEDDPAATPGSAHVVLDVEGKLVHWSHWPVAEPSSAPGGDQARAELATPSGSPTSEETWSRLLALAGLPADELRPIDSDFVPRVFAHETRAWGWVDADDSGGAQTVHAATWNGRPVQFELHSGDEVLGWSPFVPAGPFVYIALALEALAALVAWTNLRKRRADLSGALVVGAFALVTHVVLIFGSTVPGDVLGFGTVLMTSLAYCTFVAGTVTIFYLALEPFARKRWPGTLISWTRLLEGRLRDPAVGREVLVGTFAGLGCIALLPAVGMTLEAAGVQRWEAGPFLTTTGMGSPIRTFCNIVHTWGDVVMYAGMAVFLLVAFRALLPVPWLGNGVWLLLVTGPSIVLNADNYTILIVQTVAALVFLLLLTRLGFLSIIGFLGAMASTVSMPQTLRPQDWYFGSGVLGFLTLVALLVWAYRAAVAGRSVFE